MQWEALRRDSSLGGRTWSTAAVEATDSWLRDVFDEAVARTGGDAPVPGPGPGGWLARRARRGGAEGTGRDSTGRDSADGGPRDPAKWGRPAPKGLALVAVGSLGRGDLAPGSDLDLLLVHAGRADVGATADAIWYPIWDDPMPLDHSVRTLSQVGEAAESDTRVALGLLDARVVAGDPALGAELLEAVRRLWSKRAGKWLPGVLAARAEAQAAQGDVAFLLEPELQEGKGGLRDVQLLSLIGKVTPVLPGISDDPALAAAADFLHAVRVELQRDSGRRTERLALEDQSRVADALGLPDREGLAHEVAKAGRAIAWLYEDASRRAFSWLKGPSGRAGSADRELGPGLVLRDGEVVVPLAVPVSEDATLPLRAAAASARLGAPLARATMGRLADEAAGAEGTWDDDLRRAFLLLLGAGGGSVHAIETLDHVGVWERYVPEWALVRNRPQFNPYHRWTVDRHLLEAAANAADHVLDVRRPDLLLMGTFLHDIGKGSGEDHSESGQAIAGSFARRAGFPPDDAATLSHLVRLHLLLPDTATRRDLEDPATITMVAERVPDLLTLELLGTLAVADGLATGAAAWTPWKAGLVGDLVHRAGALMAGRALPSGPPFPTADQRRLMSAGGVQVVPGPRDLTVVAPDRPGLFSDITGALALHGIGILEARAHSEEGHVLDVFVLDLPEHADPRWDRVAADLEGAVLKRFNVSEALARRPAPRRARRAAALAQEGARVLVDNDAATNATVVEVRAPDVPGLLHRVSAALAGLDLDIVSARVATLGTAVVDTFYVQAEGGKLARPADAEHLARVLQGTLQDSPAGLHK